MGSICVGVEAEAARKPAQGGTQRRDVVELGVGYGLILGVAWTPGWWQTGLYLVTIAWLTGVLCLRFVGWDRMGLRAVGFLRSFWIVGLGFGIALGAVAVSKRLGTLNRPYGAGLFVRTFLGYAIWSFVQQILLQVFVLQRLIRLMPRRRWLAIVVAAGMFAVIHLPNPLLTGLTLGWGLLACWLFLRYRNIYTLGMTHAMLGVCLAIVVPGRVDHNMRVGLGYLRYQQQEQGRGAEASRSHAAEAWVMADDPMRPSVGAPRQ